MNYIIFPIVWICIPCVFPCDCQHGANNMKTRPYRRGILGAYGFPSGFE